MEVSDKEVKVNNELVAQAKQVLENSAFKKAFEDIQNIAWEKFKGSGGRDTEGREKIYWFLKALEELKGQLTVYLSDEIVEKSKEKTVEEEFQERFNIA